MVLNLRNFNWACWSISHCGFRLLQRWNSRENRCLLNLWK